MTHKFLILTVIGLIGTTSCSPECRVVNGTATDISKYPFAASLRVRSKAHYCGCTIIAPSWISTAAHCVHDQLAKIMSIEYGTTKISAKGKNVVGVKRFIVHENYDHRTVAPVILPESNFEIPQTQEGAPGYLAGWGLNATGGCIQCHLQEVNLKMYSDKECNSRHKGDTTNDHICGGVDESGKGQCAGDSDGPLLYYSARQLGIASRSKKPCAEAPYPGVYTKVSHYVKWIYKHIDKF